MYALFPAWRDSHLLFQAELGTGMKHKVRGSALTLTEHVLPEVQNRITTALADLKGT